MVAISRCSSRTSAGDDSTRNEYRDGLTERRIGRLDVFSVRQPDYPNVDQMAGETATLFGITFDIVDLEHARAVPTEWVIPGEVRWTLDAETAAQSGGGRYLGVSVFLLAFVGAVYSWRRSWIWSTVAMTCLALSLGSLVYGVGGVFCI